MCVHNEEDVLDVQLSFHLNAGVDQAIVTDTGSNWSSGTTTRSR